MNSNSGFTVQRMVIGAVALAALLATPHFLSFHHQDLLIFLTINVLAVCSYRLVTLTGEWSLIHAVMMGVGAYTVALLVNHFDLAIWFTLPLAGTAAGARDRVATRAGSRMAAPQVCAH